MKVFSKLMFAILALTLVVACKNKPEGEKAAVGEAAKEVAKAAASAKSYAISNGTINWTSTKVGGQHSGTIKVGKGTVSVENGNVTSGEFAIDMTSIDVTDGTEGKMKEKLIGHLKSPDFFNVGEHSVGNFKVVSVKAVAGESGSTHEITGNLTLKGITKSITFPANILVAGNALTAVSPAFKINRTDWDIKYGSGLIGTAKDKIIHDEISLVLDLTGAAN